MDALAEKYARRAVQLTYNHTFCAVDDKGALVRHVRDRTKIYILYHGSKILMVRIGAIQLQLGLQRNAVGQTPFKTLRNAVLRRVYVVVQKLEDEIVARVCNGEILREDLIQTLFLTLLRGRVKLQKIPE